MLNPFAEEWRLYSVERLIEIGWKESFKLMKEAVQSGRCINYNAQIECVSYDDRIDGKSPRCGQHYSMQINDLPRADSFHCGINTKRYGKR